MVSVIADADAIWRWLESELEGRPVPSLLVLIGFGSGDLLDALERHAPSTRVLALEPDPVNAAAFRARPGVDAWLAGGRLVYLADPEYAGADEAWRIFPPTGGEPTVLVHPDLVLGPGVARATQVLKKILFGVEANAEARRKFAPRYLLNSIRNIPAIVRGRDIRELTDLYRGVPAIIAAAGPSLDHAIGDLRAFQHRALLIAADTALRPLLLHGIAPHLAVGLDPGEANLRHFLALPECGATRLVAESALDPQAAATFDDRTFWFRVSNHHPWPFLRELGLDVGQIDVWGSVLTAAFQTAVLAGCDPIVVVGADLAFTGGQPYARGTTYEFDWAWNAARGVDTEESWREQLDRSRPRLVPDLHGRSTWSSESLVAFRDWLIARIGRSGRRVINATGAGILHGASIEQLPLARALEGTGAFLPKASRGPDPAPSAERIAARLREARAALGADPAGSSPAGEWSEFSGPGFDPATVAAALDQAVLTLELGGSESGRGHVDAGIQVGDANVSRHHILDLPERVGRFRDALIGREPQHRSVAPGERPVTIARAARLLGEIGTELSRTPELIPAHHTAAAAPHPVSAQYHWPAALRWRILEFEALLGSVSAATSIRHDTPFFDVPVRLRGSADAPPVSPCQGDAARAYDRLAMQWARYAGDGETLVLPAPPDTNPALLARRLTGTITGELGTHDITFPGRQTFLRAPLLQRPRVLTDEGLQYATIAYQTERGAVCISPRFTSSVVVRVDGAVERNFEWPHPVGGELPFGDGGAVAWGNGSADPEMLAPPYVMYRADSSAPVSVVELPVRPSQGWWWQGRLYLNCYPGRGSSWQGLVSWAPGEAVREELADVLLCGFHATDDHLVLHPCIVRPGIGIVRQLVLEGWRWTPGERPLPTTLGPFGAASSRATAGRWTATAHPEADVVLFEFADHRTVTMTCYSPWRLAWVGRSLIVSTTEREILGFEDIAARLDALLPS